ncbi:MAG: NTP transferase domain-containing protein [Candidatus Bipolaricaulota bacterium]|nr:NTP transferase domain-containing protein [Candidatus Bipolaricaulota bacterium]
MACKLTVLILAVDSGLKGGKRSGALKPVSGHPVISYVVRAVQGIYPGQVMIIGAAAELQAEVGDESVQLFEGPTTPGDGGAILQTQGKVQGDNLLILPGNLPLITAGVLDELVNRHVEKGAGLSFLTAGEANSGIYCVRIEAFFWDALAAIGQEYHPSRLIERYNSSGRNVLAVALTDPAAVMVVGSPVDQSEVESRIRLRTADKLMRAGVRIIDPAHTYIEPGIKVGVDTLILPGTHLRGGSSVGKGCTIGPDSWIENSVVERGSSVRYSVVESARIRSSSAVGPYAHLRPGADIGPEVRIGNFVEIKEARVRRGAKVGHLTYIGDADVGEGANIGAGTITCNYDGKRKNRTLIGERAFVGSNVSLVAPITIGARAIIGAGSTITEDVPPRSLALGRARQINKRRE